MEYIVFLFGIALCGASVINPENRISNGNLAGENHFPYTVSLQQLSQIQSPTRGHRCGGVLVTYQHVVTAASCLYDVVNGRPQLIEPAQYRVFTGSVLLTNDTVQDRIKTIANITVHPQYIGTPAHLHDIAVITLTTPFLRNITEPIALPASDFEPADFALCNVAGWGAPNNSALASTELKFTTKYIYSQNLCTMLYSTHPDLPNIWDTMLCAASYDIVSSGCVGDQGNPLICNGGLAGILFMTNGCTESAIPELYTRVSNYTVWIRSITGGAAAFQPSIVVLSVFALVQIITAKIVC